MKVLVSVALVIMIAVLAALLATAPLHERYSEQQCRDAYARARTRLDTVAVDFKPLANRRGNNPRCRELRIARPSDAAEILARRQPNEDL